MGPSDVDLSHGVGKRRVFCFLSHRSTLVARWWGGGRLDSPRGSYTSVSAGSSSGALQLLWDPQAVTEASYNFTGLGDDNDKICYVLHRTYNIILL